MIESFQSIFTGNCGRKWCICLAHVNDADAVDSVALTSTTLSRLKYVTHVRAAIVAANLNEKKNHSARCYATKIIQVLVFKYTVIIPRDELVHQCVVDSRCNNTLSMHPNQHLEIYQLKNTTGTYKRGRQSIHFLERNGRILLAHMPLFHPHEVLDILREKAALSILRPFFGKDMTFSILQQVIYHP